MEGLALSWILGFIYLFLMVLASIFSIAGLIVGGMGMVRYRSENLFKYIFVVGALFLLFLTSFIL